MSENPQNTPAQTSANHAPLWMKLLLAGSLGVNVLIAGAAISLAIHTTYPDTTNRKPPKGDARLDREFRNMTPLGRALTEDDRKAIAQRLRDDRRGMIAFRRDMLGVVVEMSEILSAEPFDRAAMAALLATQKEKIDGFVTHGQTVLLDYLETMSLENRRALAERLQQPDFSQR